MSVLDGPLGAIFSAALGTLFRDGMLRKTREADNGVGGFVATATEVPVKVSADAIGAANRAASGLPSTAVRLTILAAGLASPPDLDDELTLGGLTYRLIRVDADPAGASIVASAVPV